MEPRAMGRVQLLPSSMPTTIRIPRTTCISSISTLTAGIHKIAAVYSGESNYLGSTSSSIGQTIFHAWTTTIVVSSDTSAIVGQP